MHAYKDDMSLLQDDNVDDNHDTSAVAANKRQDEQLPHILRMHPIPKKEKIFL